MEILIISALSIVLIFLAFITGLHYGSKVKNNETIDIPNPVRKIKDKKAIKKAKEKINKEQEIEEINLANIDSYDGTDLGQLDFPKE